MSHRIAFLISFTALFVAACGTNLEGQANSTDGDNNRVPDVHAAATPADVVALGLSEAQLLNADLVAVNGSFLADVEQINHNGEGKATSLVIEIDRSNPDRYVILPLQGLTVRKAGGDTDLQTSMTPEQLSSLPKANRLN